MRSNYKRIGDYVTQVKLKNSDGTISLLKGININKYFMPSVANIIGTDLSKYRVVKKNQFAFNPMHVGRDEILPISISEDDEPIIVSPAYLVFKVKDENLLLPEYLMMWFRRSEFDRNAWFMTDNSVRGGFSWSDFCDMEMPIPCVEKQHEIVRDYSAINKRIELNDSIIRKLENASQAVYKYWFMDFEFPITKKYAQSIGKPQLEGKPYKLFGGDFEYCEILDKCIPIGWKKQLISEVGKVITGKTPSSLIKDSFGEGISFITPTDYKNYNKYAINSIRKLSTVGELSLKNKIIPIKSLLVTCIGSDMGKVVINLEPCITNQQINTLIPKKIIYSEYLYYMFVEMYDHLRNIAIGSSTMPMINKSEFGQIKILLPSPDVCLLFDSYISAIAHKQLIVNYQNLTLRSFKDLLLQKMVDV